MGKIQIETELLNTLNTALAEREAAIEKINKANTDEKTEEVKPAVEEKEDVEELLRRNMEGAMKLSVKLTCDMNSAENWYDLK